jgi:hypothetical protein
VIALSWPQVDFSGPWLDFDLYTGAEIFWYAVGFVLWTPAYVAIIRIGLHENRLEIPIIAVLGNATWEFMWGFLFRVDMGWLLQLIYQAAFVLDCWIIYYVFKYGREQLPEGLPRRAFPWITVGVVALWALFYAGIRGGGYDLPLGSSSAYLLNIVESGVYLWIGLITLEPLRQSFTVAWSKGFGSGMVAVFVFLRYDGNDFIQAIAVITAVLDVVYMAVLLTRRRDARRSIA